MIFIFSDMTYFAILIILDLTDVNYKLTWYLRVIQAIFHMIFFVYYIGLNYYFLKMAEEYFIFYQYSTNIRIRERVIFYTVSFVFFMSSVNNAIMESGNIFTHNQVYCRSNAYKVIYIITDMCAQLVPPVFGLTNLHIIN